MRAYQVSPDEVMRSPQRPGVSLESLVGLARGDSKRAEALEYVLVTGPLQRSQAI